ncbi:uncharacterized protein RCC_02437 [Ramularia collo-cygni]|uniref:Nascent polypeptide-associated complex subunit alpha-like UBA domain-containing protein n=1 Tax=Ramularia collo-cygni TaxID=112498 RepID=A0A2D3V8B3_9PEZI|nr:uncharacterized protein RCC_02437 [Ramularia collo-cygni]CZT16603.1 uncharacterized protein RCC_02437 [Ramularia collo-cygni]
MAEPQPNNVTEGADPPDVVPASEEDRKAAQAMSSLDATGADEAPKKEVDQEALSKALKDFELSQAPKKTTSGNAVKKEAAPKKIIKLDPAEVASLAEQLDLSKARATELLRAHEGDTLKAMVQWVSSAV